MKIAVAEDCMKPQQREWPALVVKFLVYLVLVGAGIVFGVMATFHTNRYLTEQNMFYRMEGKFQKGSGCTAKMPVGSLKSKKNHRMVRLSDWISPQKTTHSMDDEELLWRASMVPARNGKPFSRSSKVAFLFLTRGPLPMIPLWEKFLKGHEGFYSVYIHAQPSFRLNVSSSSPFYGRQIPSKAVQWGETNMCDAERRLLANALLDLANKRFVLLSESCIPVYDFKTVYGYLMKSRHSFVHSFDDPSMTGRGRYSQRMAPLVTLQQWRKGSQWFEMHRNLALQVISDNVYYPVFKQYCTPPCYIDEHYLPTFFSMKHGHLNANRSVTWVDWSRGGSHPATFGKGDLTELFLKKIRYANSCTYNSNNTSLCYLFARKFSVSALAPLLNMSSMVLGY